MEHRRHASPTGSVPPARSPRAAIDCTPVSQTQERRRCGTTTDPSPCGSYLIAAPLNSAESSIQSGDLPLILVSLKAGGTGLNLTAADTVIVYDP